MVRTSLSNSIIKSAQQPLQRRHSQDADETDAPETLLSLRDAAAALGLRPATVTQDILRGQLAAVRVPHGNATHLFGAPAELERYRRASLGTQGWDDRRRHAPPAPADEPGAR